MKKLTLYALSAALLSALLLFCNSPANSGGGKEPIPIVSDSTAVLEIRNDSRFTLDSVVWNDVSFGSIPKNANKSKEIGATSTGSYHIVFTIAEKKIRARTQHPVTVALGAKATQPFYDDFPVEEMKNGAPTGNIMMLSALQENRPPKLGLIDPYYVTYDSIKVMASVADSGHPKWSARGICVSRDTAGLGLEINCRQTNDDFVRTVDGLEVGTKYLVTAYIDNNAHPRQYGDTITVETRSGVPSVGNTMVLGDIGYDAVTIQARIISEGYPSYTENGKRGFCLWTDTIEIKEHAYVVEGEHNPFSMTFRYPELRDSTRYFVKAYVDNGIYDIAYGQAFTFTTRNAVRVDSVINITLESVLLRATVLSTSNPAYSEKGFCYSQTDPLPKADSDAAIAVEVDGTEAVFEYQMESLQFGATYHVRAYIKNDYGTRYSAPVTFVANVFVDERDSRGYRVQDIGNGDIWFIDDLAYGGKTLYTWAEAKTACPDGWHLPSSTNWIALDRARGYRVDFLGMNSESPSTGWWSSLMNDYNGMASYFYVVRYESFYFLETGNKSVSAVASVRCVQDSRD